MNKKTPKINKGHIHPQFIEIGECNKSDAETNRLIFGKLIMCVDCGEARRVWVNGEVEIMK